MSNSCSSAQRSVSLPTLIDYGRSRSPISHPLSTSTIYLSDYSTRPNSRTSNLIRNESRVTRSSIILHNSHDMQGADDSKEESDKKVRETKMIAKIKNQYFEDHIK